MQEEKRRLEERIALLTSQMIRGEVLTRHPDIQHLMKETQERMKQEYAYAHRSSQRI
jgi:hypothetical protein